LYHISRGICFDFAKKVKKMPGGGAGAKSLLKNADLYGKIL